MKKKTKLTWEMQNSVLLFFWKYEKKQKQKKKKNFVTHYAESKVSHLISNFIKSKAKNITTILSILQLLQFLNF